MNKSAFFLASTSLTRRRFAKNLFLIAGGLTFGNTMNMLFASTANANKPASKEFDTKSAEQQHQYINVWSADNRWMAAKFIRMEHPLLN